MRHRDYQTKSFHNPHFPRKEKRGSLKFKLLLVFFLIIILAGIYFLVTTDKLEIKNIEVIGAQRVNQQEVKSLVLEQVNKRRWLFFKQKNIFFFKSSSLEKDLNGTYLFDDFKVEKKYFSTLIIEIKEKADFLVWVTGNGVDKYYLDLDGLVIDKLDSQDMVIEHGEDGTDIMRSEFDSPTYPLVHDQSNTSVDSGQKIASKSLINFIYELNRQIGDSADFNVSYYLVNDPKAQEVTLVTKEGWLVYFDAKKEVKSQIDLLMLILQQKVSNRSELEYIDLRFGEKVFFK